MTQKKNFLKFRQTREICCMLLLTRTRSKTPQLRMCLGESPSEPSGTVHLPRAINFYCFASLTKVTMPWDHSSLPGHLTLPWVLCGPGVWEMTAPLPLTSCIFMTPHGPKYYESRYFIVRTLHTQDCFLLYFFPSAKTQPHYFFTEVRKICHFPVSAVYTSAAAASRSCQMCPGSHGPALTLAWEFEGSQLAGHVLCPLSLSYLSIRSLKAECSPMRTRSWRDDS